jgi:hypothetical protein
MGGHAGLHPNICYQRHCSILSFRISIVSVHFKQDLIIATPRCFIHLIDTKRNDNATTTQRPRALPSSTRLESRTNQPFNPTQPPMLQVAAPPSERTHQAHYQPRQQNSHPPFTLSVTKPASASTEPTTQHHKYGSAHIPALAALASLAAIAPAAPVKRESVRYVHLSRKSACVGVAAMKREIGTPQRHKREC